MDDVNHSILQRVPLAQAALMVLAHATREPFLDDLYDRNRGRCYEKVLSFSMLVRLLEDALIQHRGSGRKSCDDAAEREAMPVTHPATMIGVSVIWRYHDRPTEPSQARFMRWQAVEKR